MSDRERIHFRVDDKSQRLTRDTKNIASNGATLFASAIKLAESSTVLVFLMVVKIIVAFF